MIVDFLPVIIVKMTKNIKNEREYEKKKSLQSVTNIQEGELIKTFKKERGASPVNFIYPQTSEMNQLKNKYLKVLNALI